LGLRYNVPGEPRESPPEARGSPTEAAEGPERTPALSLEVSEELDAYQQRHAR